MQACVMALCAGIKIVMVTRGRSFAPAMTEQYMNFNEKWWVHLSAAAHTCMLEADISCLMWRNWFPELQSRHSAASLSCLSYWINKPLFHFVNCYSAAWHLLVNQHQWSSYFAISRPLNLSTQLAGIIVYRSLCIWGSAGRSGRV